MKPLIWRYRDAPLPERAAPLRAPFPWRYVLGLVVVGLAVGVGVRLAGML